MGGYAALAAARRAPERLAGLLLAGSRPEADTPERYAKRAETIAIARERGAEGVWDAMRATLFDDGSDPDVVARARELALDRTENELVTALEAIRDRPDSTRGVPRARRPGAHGRGRPRSVRAGRGRAPIRAGRGRAPRVRAPGEPRASRRVRPRTRRRGGPVDVERDEVVRRLGEEGFVVLDVRSAGEYRGEATAPCDPRPGRIAGAEHFDLQVLLALTPDEIRERLGPPEDVELVAYCHSGLAFRARDTDPRLARLPRLELPWLLARVVAGRLAARRDRLGRPRGTPSRAAGRAGSRPRSARASQPAAPPGRRRRRDPQRATTRPAPPAPRDGTERPTRGRAGRPACRPGCGPARRRPPGGRVCSDATGRRRSAAAAPTRPSRQRRPSSPLPGASRPRARRPGRRGRRRRGQSAASRGRRRAWASRARAAARGSGARGGANRGAPPRRGASRHPGRGSRRRRRPARRRPGAGVRRARARRPGRRPRRRLDRRSGRA